MSRANRRRHALLGLVGRTAARHRRIFADLYGDTFLGAALAHACTASDPLVSRIVRGETGPRMRRWRRRISRMATASGPVINGHVRLVDHLNQHGAPSMGDG